MINTAMLGFALRDLRSGGRSLVVFCACLVLGVMLVAATGGLFQQVRDALAGNLCRCGSHARVIRAVLRAAGAAPGAR